MHDSALAYRVFDDRRGFLDLYAGARYNYLGVDVQAATDSRGIQNFSTGVIDRVTNRINEGVQQSVQSIRNEVAAAVAATKQNLTNQIVDSMEQSLSGRGGIAEQRSRDFRREGSDPRRAQILSRLLRGDRTGALADYIRAAVELEVARARGEQTTELENKAANAKSKASKQLAKNIEDALPTQGSGNEWWVDPIVGLRGQINFTRWLYLTAQADVGGFGVGSQIAWNVIGAAGINLTRNISAELGYRYMYEDYSNDTFLYLMNSYGIYSSLGFRF